jgi:hypothetical protein
MIPKKEEELNPLLELSNTKIKNYNNNLSKAPKWQTTID